MLDMDGSRMKESGSWCMQWRERSVSERVRERVRLGVGVKVRGVVHGTDTGDR